MNYKLYLLLVFIVYFSHCYGFFRIGKSVRHRYSSKRHYENANENLVEYKKQSKSTEDKEMTFHTDNYNELPTDNRKFIAFQIYGEERKHKPEEEKML